MKLYLNNGNILNVNDNAILEITNLEEFLEILNKNSSKVPSPHFSLDLNYKLIVNGQEYMGTTTCDSYHGFTSKIDSNCPYLVELKNWKLSQENDDKYFEFEIMNK